MKFKLTYKAYGAFAVLIEWPSRIDARILEDILSFKTKLEGVKSTNIVTITHTYQAVLVTYTPKNFNFEVQVAWLQDLYAMAQEIRESLKRIWRIPVCYDTSLGIDLETLSRIKGLTIAEVVAKHTAPVYTIYFIGFLPGFLYLGGLDEGLALPRKPTPRLKIEPGAVAIGGKQTGVYPSQSPGGWHIIGSSPVCFFDATKRIPCFAQAGDAIQFFEVSLKTYHSIKVLAKAGVYQIENKLIDD